MSDTTQWSFREEMQPREDDVEFELQPLLEAVVALRAEVPDDAFTADTLGTERGGNGVVIDDEGTVLTIGYLITEASSIWLTTSEGRVVPAYSLAYDQVTGFGLVRPLAALDVPSIPRAGLEGVGLGDRVFMLGNGGRSHALKARVVDTRLFAGYWEYLIEQAIFTSPAHPEWSGAALINEHGQLIGIGSLLVQAVESEGSSEAEQANLSVPVSLLEPILPSLLSTGASGLAARPWLGIYANENEGQVVVMGIARQGPAERAGLQQGDLILEIAGQRVESLAALYRVLWGLGPAGVEVPMLAARDGDLLRLKVASVDRNSLLRRPSLH
jgi:S1-C subfamily serine protease